MDEIKIWNEGTNGTWTEFYGYDGHQGSGKFAKFAKLCDSYIILVNDMVFGKLNNLLCLYSCSTDGSISFITGRLHRF
jgi:hypothetical protein